MLNLMRIKRKNSLIGGRPNPPLVTGEKVRAALRVAEVGYKKLKIFFFHNCDLCACWLNNQTDVT